MKQIAPAASAIPGFGTSSLPLATEPALSHPYLIMSEPHQDSCDGMAGTQGWTDVTMQAAFDSDQSPTALGEQMGRRLVALGWERKPIESTPQNQMMWTKKLQSGARATIEVQQAAASSTVWEFLVEAPPTGTAASGC